MNRIKLLPEHVANQIAAGEVVERPASVVKELVENALDAGAKKISVEIQAGGRSLIRVTDDGIGMNRDDALLCLERHATSKIQRAEDLSSIATMGFRGEALPSIASVSKFTLTTRERDGDSPEATQIIIAGGKISEVKAAGSATGTSIEVRQLFFNLPARRKFLRTEETEAAHTLHYLTLAALAYPEVAFTFVKDGRPVWQLPAQKSGSDENSQFLALRERIRTLTGDVKLIPVNFSAPFAMPDDDSNEVFETARLAEEAQPPFVTTIREANDKSGQLTSGGLGKPHRHSSIRVWGFIGSPGVSRATREDQHLFVNRRPVENRGLNFALLEGYHTALMKGRYPVCCLFVEIDPAAVDVNIHPAKREVKFHREADVRRFVAQAVREALLEFHAAGHKKEPAPAQPSLPTRPIEKPVSRGSTAQTTELPAFTPQPIKHSSPPPQPVEQQSLRMGFSHAPTTPVPTQPLVATSPTPSFSTQPSVVPLLSVPLRLVGVVGKLYVVLESDRGLVLLDQHAAHERILFEQMLERLERNTQAPSQKLLLPETIELSPRDAQFMREQLPSLGRLGVGLSEFGERTFLLDALPPFVKVSDARRFVLDLVDELKSAGKDINSARLGEHVVAKTVCRHAVKANDPLAGRELENLVEDLRRCAMPYTCPHGRPTLIEMNYRELEKKFGRAQ